MRALRKSLLIYSACKPLWVEAERNVLCLCNFPSTSDGLFYLSLSSMRGSRILAYIPTPPKYLRGISFTFPFLPRLVFVKHRRCRPYQWKSSALQYLLASLPSHVRPLVLRRPKIATIGDLPWLNLSLHEIGMSHSQSPKHLQQILPVLFSMSRLHLPAKHTTAIYSTRSVTTVFPFIQSC